MSAPPYVHGYGVVDQGFDGDTALKCKPLTLHRWTAVVRGQDGRQERLEPFIDRNRLRARAGDGDGDDAQAG